MNKSDYLNIISYNKGGGDDQYTPRYGVECILPYIRHLKDKVFWLPFDTEESYFYKVLTENGYKVLISSIETGQDFFEYEPEEHWDVILSSPPFKNKKKFIERAKSFGKPFALLLPINSLSDSVFNGVFKDTEIQFLIPDKRICFYHKEHGWRDRPSFKVAYIGQGFFERQIIFVDINTKERTGF